MGSERFDKIIIGAGLYGLYSALFCCKKGENILVLEYDPAPFKRATYINQARVHQGYHYPRSISTAVKSAGYFERFNRDYDCCVNKEFDQIYATSSQYSWSDRKQFKDGGIDKYTWVDIGSSYCPSEITAAFLYANLQHIDEVIKGRLRITKKYQQFFEPYEKQGILQTPHPLPESKTNAHMYFVLMNSLEKRNHLLQHLNNHNIAAQTHFVPLHSAPYAKL